MDGDADDGAADFVRRERRGDLRHVGDTLAERLEVAVDRPYAHAEALGQLGAEAVGAGPVLGGAGGLDVLYDDRGERPGARGEACLQSRGQAGSIRCCGR